MKKSWNLPSNFSMPGKILENRDEVWKKFFYNKCFLSELFFLMVKLYSISPVCLQHIIIKLCSCIFLKVSTAHLFDNLESGKRNFCFEKSLEKSWILDPKICTNPGKRDQSYKCHYLTLTRFRYMYPVENAVFLNKWTVIWINC